MMEPKCLFFVMVSLLCAISSGKQLDTKERDFAFGKPYDSHMVLQRAPSSAVIWGYGTAGGSVIIEIDGTAVLTFVNADDTWTATLPPHEAGGPFTLTAVHTLGDINTTLNIEDILFGDVWLCSGQSNMEMAMGQIFNATEEIESSLGYTQIRLFRVENTISETPLTDFSAVKRTWTLPTEDSLGLGQGWDGYSAVCFLYGRNLYDQFKIPIGLVDSTWGGTIVESWSSTDALSQCSPASDKISKSPEANLDVNDPSALYNAMINPFIRTSIRGVIWYQGETNVGRPNYECMFPAMINDWRAKWNAGTNGSTDPLFPFGFVQLAQKHLNAGDDMPLLRWAQTANFGYAPNAVMVNTFMAVAMDLEDDESPDGSNHPRDKQTVAYRLATAGFNIAYGLTEYPISGPQYYILSVDFTTNLAILKYDRPLQQRNATGFMADCGMGWVDVPFSVNSDTNTVTVDLSSCPQAARMAYEWRETPCPYKECALYSNDEYQFPAAPWIWYLR